VVAAVTAATGVTGVTAAVAERDNKPERVLASETEQTKKIAGFAVYGCGQVSLLRRRTPGRGDKAASDVSFFCDKEAQGSW
jgi:hypothetical protein